jgi:hypothetical protein
MGLLDKFKPSSKTAKELKDARSSTTRKPPKVPVHPLAREASVDDPPASRKGLKFLRRKSTELVVSWPHRLNMRLSFVSLANHQSERLRGFDDRRLFFHFA